MSTDSSSPADTDGRTDSRKPVDSGSSTLAKQGSIAFSGNIVKKLFGFLIIAVITRLVSPSVYGLFVLATSIVLLIQTFASLGLPKAIDYFVPQYLEEEQFGMARGVILQVTFLVVITSGITAFVVFFSAERISLLFGEPALRIPLLILALTVPLLAMYNVLLASFNSIKKLKYRVYMRDFIRPSVRLATTTGLLLAGFGLIGLVAGYFVGLLVAICAGAVFLRRNATAIFEAETRTTQRTKLLWYSLPLAFAGIIYTVMGQIDYFVIGYFRGADDVGIYRVGYMLAANLLIVFSSVAPIFKPLIAERKDDTATVTKRYRVAARWIAALTLPIAITLALGANSYLSVLFTPQYAAANLAVLVLAIGYLVSVSCGGPDGTLLQGLGYSRLVFVNTIVLLGTNAILSVLLVPRIGILGAATGTATALSLTGLIALGQVYYLRGIHPFTGTLVRTILAAIPSTIAGGAVVVLLPSHLAIALVLPVVVFVVYLLSLVVLKGITEEDIDVATQINPKFGRKLRNRLRMVRLRI